MKTSGEGTTVALTDAEAEVYFLLVTTSLSHKEIAMERGVSPKTVDTQVNAIFRKYGIPRGCRRVRLVQEYWSTVLFHAARLRDVPYAHPAYRNRDTHSAPPGAGAVEYVTASPSPASPPKVTATLSASSSLADAPPVLTSQVAGGARSSHGGSAA